VGGKGGGGGRGEKWPKPCMHIWIIKLKKKLYLVLWDLGFGKYLDQTTGPFWLAHNMF
jgi:hypothetical protein